MTILNRYLLRQAMFYLLLCLSLGIGMYFLVDMFSRLPELLEAKVSLPEIARYFAAKIPILFAQALPAVFLLALVIFFSIMKRSNELLSLASGGISLWVIIKFVILFAGLWCVLQFVFSQVVGVRCEETANRIWNERVKKNKALRQYVENLWVKDGDRIISVARFWPNRAEGQDITIYFLSAGQKGIEKIIKAKKAVAHPDDWELFYGVESHTQDFSSLQFDRLVFPVGLDLDALLATKETRDDGTSFDPVSLPVWKLGTIIRHLKSSGSNVERLKTSLYMKWAYAFSLMSMGLMAVALISFGEGIYVNALLSLGSLFLFYFVFMSGVSAAQSAAIPAWIGAWAANIMVGGLALIRLFFLFFQEWTPYRSKQAG